MPSLGRGAPPLFAAGRSQAPVAFVAPSADASTRRAPLPSGRRRLRPPPPPHESARSVFAFGRGCRWTSSRFLRADREPRRERARHARLSGCGRCGRGTQRPLLGRHVSLAPPPPRLGARGWGRATPRRFRPRPQIRRDDPLNLSILLSGGKETNQDSLSSGERRGRSPAPNPRPAGGRGTCGVQKSACPASLGGLSPSDRGSARGRCEAGNGPRRAGARSSRSRVVWECSPKRVVNSI